MSLKEILISLLLRLLVGLSPRAAQSLGGFVGRLFIYFPNREKNNARINIDLCFPELSGREREELVGRALIENAKTLAEMPGIWSGDRERWLSPIRKEEGAVLLQTLLKRGKGVILAGPHLGNWEIAGLLLGSLAPVTTLYRPPRYEGVETFMRRGRSRTGATLVATDASGVKALYKALRQGEMVAILPDQQPKSPRGAVFAPFFGVPALTMELVSRLARKTGAPVLFCFAERLPRGEGFRMHWLPAPEGIDSADPVEAATALNRGVEACVRRCPEQYQWTYKRFQIRPDNGPNPY